MVCLLWQNLSISCTASLLHPTDAETKASLWGEATAITGTLFSSSQALEEYSFRFHTLRLLSKLLISNLYPPSSFKFTFPCSSSNIKWGMMGTDLQENQILTSGVRLYALPWHGCHGWLGGKSHSRSAMSHTDLQPWMQQTHYCMTIAA